MDSTSLTNALAARIEARTRYQAASEALERARQVHKDAEAEVARLAGEEARWVERHSKRLADWIAAGSKGSSPTLVADAKAQQALTSARAAAVAAAQALTAFETAERESRQALVAAEATARRTAIAILAAEGDALAEKIIERDRETDAMRRQLQGLRELVPPSAMVRRAAPASGDWVNTPIPQLREIEASATGADRSRVHTPINKLDTFEVDPSAVEHWRKRLNDLLSSNGAPEPSERAA